MPRRTVATAFAAFVALSLTCQAFGPIIYQGKLWWGDDPYDGTALFKFALLNGPGTETYWSNDGTSTSGGQPQRALSVRVTKGNYTVLLGNPNSPDRASSASVYLRVWCSIGGQSFQRIADQRLVLDGRKNIIGVVQRIPRSRSEVSVTTKSAGEPRVWDQQGHQVGAGGSARKKSTSAEVSASPSYDLSGTSTGSHYHSYPTRKGSAGRPAPERARESEMRAEAARESASRAEAASSRQRARESEMRAEAPRTASSREQARESAMRAKKEAAPGPAASPSLSSSSTAPQGTSSETVETTTTTTTTTAASSSSTGTSVMPSAESSGASKPTEGTIERMPHMDCDPSEPAQPGKNIKVSIWADTSGQRPGEDDYWPMKIPFPSDTDEIRVVVYLVLSPQFALVGKEDSKELVIRKQESASDKLTFKLRVENNAEGIGHITALFFYNGYPCGRVMRSLRIGYPDEEDATASALSNAASAGTTRKIESSSSIALSHDGPDMTITVIRTDAGPRYQYFVMAPKAKTPRGPVLDWDNYTDPTPQSILESYYTRFGQPYVRQQTRASLADLGRTLFPKAPRQVRSTLRELIDENNAPRTVLIFSDEPYFAWELIIPHWPDKEMSDSLPLGALSAVGRWTCNPQEVFRSPARHVPINKTAFWAPKYTEGEALKNSQSEQEFLQRAMEGRAIPPTYNGICSNLATNDATVLHFICHGVSDPSEQGMQKILADAEEIPSTNGSANSDTAEFHTSITAGELTLCDGVRQFCSKRPLIFLNACQVGKVIQTLSGNGGFGPAFLDANAGGVVAPLWSVFDQVAESTAKRFYTDLKADPQLGFAEEIRRIRESAYKGEMVDGMSTLAAYTFYGDPLATSSTEKSR